MAVRHIFQWDGKGKEVFLVDSFNNWEKIPMKTPNGVGGVCVDLELPAGTYNYMFIVDGEWRLDPSNTLPITSTGQNQVILTNFEIQSSDDDDSDTESIASQASSTGSAPRGQVGQKIYLTFPEEVRGQVEGYLRSSLGYKDNIIKFHILNAHSACITVTPPSIAEHLISMLGVMSSDKFKIKAKLYEGRGRSAKKKRDGRVGADCVVGSSSGSSPETCSVYVGSNLPEYTNEQHIKDHFRKFASSIVKIELIQNKKAGKLRFAFVHFSNAKSAQDAIQSLNHSTMLGIRIKVSPKNMEPNVASLLPSPSSKGRPPGGLPCGQGGPLSGQGGPPFGQGGPLSGQGGPLFGQGAQGTPFLVPSHHVDAPLQGDDDEDLSDNESVTSNLSAYGDKIKVIVHSKPKFPDRLSNRAFRKHFREFSGISLAFVVKNRKTKKSLGFGIIFFSSLDVAQLATEKFLNTKIEGKYQIISMGIETKGNPGPPHHSKGGQKGPDLPGSDRRGSDPPLRDVSQPHSPHSGPIISMGIGNPGPPHNSVGHVSVHPQPVGHVSVHPQPVGHVGVHTQPVHGYPQEYSTQSSENCVVIENIDLTLGESEVSSLLAPIKMLSFSRCCTGVMIKLYSYDDSCAAVQKLNGKICLGNPLRVYIPHDSIPISHGNTHPTTFQQMQPLTHQLGPDGVGTFPPPRFEHSHSVPFYPGNDVNPGSMHVNPNAPGPMHVIPNAPGPMHVNPNAPGPMCVTAPSNQGDAYRPRLEHSQSIPYPGQEPHPSPTKESSSPGLQSTSIKVTHLPPTVTQEKLYLHFGKAGEIDGEPVLHATAKSIYAHINFYNHLSAVNAARLDNSLLDGVPIRVKLSKVSKPVRSPAADSGCPDNCEKLLKLKPAQWNALMWVNPTSETTQFKEIMSPFNCNPNVVVQPVNDSQEIKFTGKRDAVQAAYEHLMKDLNKELSIERFQMEALVNLKPSLPIDISQKCNVKVIDYKPGITSIKFEGSSSGIEMAHGEVKSLVDSLLKKEIPVQEYELDQFKKVRAEIKDPVYICAPETLPRKSVIFYAFEEPSLQRTIPFVVGSLSISRSPLKCNDLEVIYLKHFNKAYTSKLPVNINYKKDVAMLSGRENDLKVAAGKIHADIFAGLCSRKFTYFCSNKYQYQMEQRILQPYESEDPTFKYFVLRAPGQKKEKSRRKGGQANTDTSDEFSICVFSKNQDFFSKICQVLQSVNPCSREYRMIREEGKEIITKMKVDLENKYYVCIAEGKMSTVIIFGLIPEEVQLCLDEMKEKVESTLVTFSYIPITTHQHNLLSFYQDDLRELRKDCSELSILGPNKDHENHSIRLRGSINQVKDVKKRLTSGLLNRDISMENFTVSCPAGLFGMWCQRWKQIKEQEGKRSKIHVSFSKGSEPSADNRLNVKFEVVGEDEVGVQEVKNAISTEGAETETKVISLSPSGINCLLKAKKEKNLSFLNNVIVNVGNVDKQAKNVPLFAPKELSDNLDTAEDLIRKFVGDRANTSHVISSKNPVVGLILASQSKSLLYIASANAIAKPQGASVQILRKPSVGVRISGTESSIATVKDLVYSAIIEAIEKTIGERRVRIKPIYDPLLSTSDFSRFESKLETDLCVICSRPKFGKLSKLICSSLIHLETPGRYVKVDICKGDIVYEEVDAIVNAANENLKHIGGLAKAISDAGGPGIQIDSDEYIRNHYVLKPGKAVCLPGGDLPCKNVIHAVGPRWSGGQEDEEQTLYFAIFESLRLAGDASLTSIALPAIGTGIFSVPEDICARASLKAVRDYFQASPHATIQNVKFVLFQQRTLDSFKPLLVSGLCGEYQYTSSSSTRPEIPLSSSIAPISLSTTSPSCSWQWYNDTGSFSYYSSEVASLLTAAYQSDPQGMTHLMIKGVMYLINFAKMVQINTVTNHSRPIHRTSSVAAAYWVYKDKRAYIPYSAEDSKSIETMYSTRDTRCAGNIAIQGRMYTFDFTQMCQVNVSTGFMRNIERRSGSAKVSSSIEMDPEEVEAGGDSDGEEVEKDLVVTLQGPHESLNAAEGKLMAKLKSSIKIQNIDTLPKKTTPALEKKLSQIARKNHIICSFEEGITGGRRVMKLEGVHFKVQAAVNAIQEEILNFHDTSMPSDEIVYPKEWDHQTTDIETFPLGQGGSEWNTVQGKFSQTMQGHAIRKILRIQNKWLWEKYERHRKRMEHKNNGLSNEKELFHGTRNNDPLIIYKGEEGFDMRFCSRGMWGIANYFAVNASYSHGYAHQGQDGREMFLVRVLTGESRVCPSDGSLRMPPVKSSGDQKSQFVQMRYDTVSGHTNGSDVYMTYDNDKSYPAYLITYN